MLLLSVLRKSYLLLTLLAAAPAFAAPVEVLETVSIPMSRYGYSWLSVYTKLQIQNLAYDKDIELSFTDPKGEVSRSKAAYLGPSADGYEIWENYHSLPLDSALGLTPEAYRLSINYSSAAGEFSLPQGQVALKSGPLLFAGRQVQVAFPIRQFETHGLPLTVVVANLSYQKQVEVHYSCDGFQTQQTQSLSFQPTFFYGYGLLQSPSPEGFELWTGYVKSSCSDLSYYVSYQVAGQSYQDGSAKYPYRSFH